MSDEQRLHNIETIFAPHLQTCMEVGNVNRVRALIAVYGPPAMKSGREKLKVIFRDAEAWLENASQYETVNGIGSMFNKEHPAVQKAMQTRLIKVHT
jgi:hypothetical protein